MALAPSAASAQGTFECSATALRIGTNSISHANPQGTPCATDSEFPINLLVPFGTLGGLQLVAVGAGTQANDPPGVGIGQGGNAQAGVAGVTLRLLGLRVSVGAVRSLVTMHCPTANQGASTPPPVLATQPTSDTVGVRVNNLNLQFNQPVVLPLGVVTIYLNRTIRSDGRLVQRAAEIQSPLLPTIVIGESVVGYSGNPCAAPPPTRTLTVSKAGTGTGTVAGPGIDCGSDCSEGYPDGTPVTLTANPAGGSTFTGWSGACTGTGTCNVTMNADTTVTATFTADPPPPQLELQKINSGPAIPGSSFDYTIAVGNIGTCTLTNVRVNDVLTGPAGTTILSTDPSSTITPAPGGLNITFPDVGPIAPNGRVTLRVRVQVPANATAGTPYDDVVSVAADCGASPVTRTFTLPEPTVEPRPQTGPCTISGSTKSTSHIEVFQGEQFAYFVNLYNSGSEPCTGTTITDALDPRLTFVSCSDGCSVAGRTLTWNVGTLAPGQSITFPVVVQVNADGTGTLPNTARADTNETPPVDLTTPGPGITGRSILAPNDPARTPDRVP